MIRHLLAVLALTGLTTPAFARSSLAAADAAFSRGDSRSARIELLNATRDNPGDPIAWMYMARVSLALGDATAAANALDRAAASGSQPDGLRHYRAHALLLAHDPKGALGMAAPDRVAPAHRGYAARMRARALADLDDNEGAAREYGVALAIIPNSPSLWIDIARFRLATGERAGAIDAAAQALRLAPKNVAALTLKGELVRDQYGLVAALSWFDRALAVNRFDVDAQLERAATLGELGRAKEMLSATRAVLLIDPDNPRAYFLQAVLAARARKFDLAETLIDRIGNALDGLPAMRLLRGAVAVAGNDDALAIETLGPLVAQQPDNAAVRRLLGLAQWRSGQNEAALASLLPLAYRPDADSYTLTLTGRAFEAMGDPERAGYYLDRAALYRFDAPADVPDGFSLDELRAAASGGQAAPTVALVRALLQAGQGEEALHRALALEAANRGAPEAHLLAGDVWSRLTLYPQASEAYRRAANLSFSEPIALRLIEALSKSGRPAAAGHVFRLFLKQNPYNLAARSFYAEQLMKHGRYAQAIPVFEGLRRRLGGRDVAITTNLAWCYLKAGRIEDALALGGEAYRLAPANASISRSYGWILHRAGKNRANALALLEQAKDQAPDWRHARNGFVEAVHEHQPIG